MKPSCAPGRPGHPPVTEQPGSKGARPTDGPSLREQALQALCERDPGRKVEATHALWQRCLACAGSDTTGATLTHRPSPGLSDVPEDAAFAAALGTEADLRAPAGALPGRPERPALVPPEAVPRRSAFTQQGLAALLHAVCHIEFNAINLALDAVWRFAGMPTAYYRDWLRVAHEEATHFGLLRVHLQSQGADYGDFAAHDGLWEMCVKTQHDITARMALVPRTLEARGLDATPPMQARLRQVGTPAAMRTVAILDTILRDEIGHVAIGNHWYGWLCARQQLDPLAHYRALSRLHRAPRLRPPFNLAARRAAGFSATELSHLTFAADGANASDAAGTPAMPDALPDALPDVLPDAL